MIINISSEYKKGNRPWHARGCLEIRGYEKTAIFRWFGNVLVEIHGTNKLEGANNKIKVLKRISYGYTDFKYFSLKIKSTICGTVNVMARYLRRGEAVMPYGIVLNAHLSLSIGRQLSRRSILRIQHRRKTYGPPRKAEQKSGNRFVTPACTVENYGKSA